MSKKENQNKKRDSYWEAQSRMQDNFLWKVTLDNINIEIHQYDIKLKKQKWRIGKCNDRIFLITMTQNLLPLTKHPDK